jgi:hypothetical protein
MSNTACADSAASVVVEQAGSSKVQFSTKSPDSAVSWYFRLPIQLLVLMDNQLSRNSSSTVHIEEAGSETLDANLPILRTHCISEAHGDG